MYSEPNKAEPADSERDGRSGQSISQVEYWRTSRLGTPQQHRGRNRLPELPTPGLGRDREERGQDENVFAVRFRCSLWLRRLGERDVGHPESTLRRRSGGQPVRPSLRRGPQRAVTKNLHAPPGVRLIEGARRLDSFSHLKPPPTCARRTARMCQNQATHRRPAGPPSAGGSEIAASRYTNIVDGR